jgi:hypothetical protein
MAWMECEPTSDGFTVWDVLVNVNTGAELHRCERSLAGCGPVPVVRVYGLDRSYREMVGDKADLAWEHATAGLLTRTRVAATAPAGELAEDAEPAVARALARCSGCKATADPCEACRPDHAEIR